MIQMVMQWAAQDVLFVWVCAGPWLMALGACPCPQRQDLGQPYWPSISHSLQRPDPHQAGCSPTSVAHFTDEETEAQKSK